MHPLSATEHGVNGLERLAFPRRLGGGRQGQAFLEIGTHLGHGTLLLACIAEANAIAQGMGSEWSVDTVDIREVNSEQGPWKDAGKPDSPRRQLESAGLGNVSFHSEGSPHVLQNDLAGKSYDLIFIDGWHRSDVVYQEISASLPLLAVDGGLLVLDDVCPAFQITRPRKGQMPGPLLAVQRVTKECSDLVCTYADALMASAPPMAVLHRSG